MPDSHRPSSRPCSRSHVHFATPIDTAADTNTVFNPTATPDDAIIAAAVKLITAIKGNLPHRLQESQFSELMRLSTIFSDTAATLQI